MSWAFIPDLVNKVLDCDPAVAASFVDGNRDDDDDDDDDDVTRDGVDNGADGSSLTSTGDARAWFSKGSA
jgi:hypothetical protein